MSFYRLLIGNWLNQQRQRGNSWLLKSKRRSKYGTYAYFPVKQSHLSNVWSVQITLCMHVINIQDHNKTICSLLWLLCPVLLWPTLRPIWNLHGIGQWSQMLRKLNIQETLGKHVPCEKCNCTVHITSYCRTELGRRLIISQVTKVVFFSKSVFASIRGTSHDVAKSIIFSKEMSIISARFLSKWLLRERWPPM